MKNPYYKTTIKLCSYRGQPFGERVVYTIISRIRKITEFISQKLGCGLIIPN